MNLLLITADDLDVASVARFGGAPEIIPTINSLADSGTTFRRAHVVAAVCQPSRSAMMTGRYPHRNGAEGFEPIDDHIPTLVDLLGDAGYRTGIIGKVEHLKPAERFRWDDQWSRDDLGAGRSPHRYGEAARAFLAEAKASGRPWFLMANTHDPHRPWHGSADVDEQFPAEQRAQIETPSRVFTPEEVEVPGFVPDLEEVRTDLAGYLSSARRADDAIAAVLAAVDEAGERDNTVVVFLSDNGIALPYAKANCYLRSTWTPLIISWPGLTRAGSEVTESFVIATDLFPTLCEAAGVTPPEDLDAFSLVPTLRDPDSPPLLRDQVVTVFHETQARLRLEMRCLRTATHGYIWNQWSDGETSYRAENMSGLTWPSMVDAATSDPALAARTDFYLHRTPDELYDLRSDPDCLTNLASSPQHTVVMEQLGEDLLQWMAETGDPLRDEFEQHLRRRRTAPADGA